MEDINIVTIGSTTIRDKEGKEHQLDRGITTHSGEEYAAHCKELKKKERYIKTHTASEVWVKYKIK